MKAQCIRKTRMIVTPKTLLFVTLSGTHNTPSSLLPPPLWEANCRGSSCVNEDWGKIQTLDPLSPHISSRLLFLSAELWSEYLWLHKKFRPYWLPTLPPPPHPSLNSFWILLSWLQDAHLPQGTNKKKNCFYRLLCTASTTHDHPLTISR